MLLALYFGGWFVMQLGCWALFRWRRAPAPQPLPAPPPRVSILIAARNEEAAIGRCLRSVRALAYPPGQLEVLLGDDGSTDRTAAVAAATMQGFAGTFRIMAIDGTLGRARGKANVLAHLTRAATTDYFLITDADICLPATWVAGLLGQLRPGRGIVTGLTRVQGPRLFDRLQGLDWLVALALIQVVSDRGQPVTAMGNNMLITREAYAAVGGYEQLPFSVTEDYALFRAVVDRGFGWVNLFEPAVLAESLPMGTWGQLLRQRRRWLRGVAALPGGIRAGLLYYGLFYPALALAGWQWGPAAVLALLAARLLTQALLVGTVFGRVGCRPPLRLLPLFEGYGLAVTLGVLWYRLRHRDVEWKGRRYR